MIFEAATQKPVAAILRPGKRPSGEEAAQVLRHVVRQVRAHQVRAHWPRVAITVCGDAHYGTPEVMDVLEDMGCFYIFGLSGNKRLAGISAPWRDDVATRRAPGLQFDRCVISKKRGPCPDQLADMIGQRFQQSRAAPHPVCECGTVQINLLAGEDF